MNNNTIHIAMADDHALFRSGLAKILNDYVQFNVTIEAIDGQDLLKKLSTAKQLPDICLLDIEMKPMNGYDTASTLTTQYPSIKIIAVSIFDNEYAVISMLHKGARAFLSKTQRPEEIIHTIQQVHEKGYYHDDIHPEVITLAMQADTKNFPKFKEHELTFLSYCCSDMPYKIIAEKMNTSQRTLDSYRDSLFKKLKVNSRSGLIMFAMQTGLHTYQQSL